MTTLKTVAQETRVSTAVLEFFQTSKSVSINSIGTGRKCFLFSLENKHRLLSKRNRLLSFPRPPVSQAIPAPNGRHATLEN